MCSYMGFILFPQGDTARLDLGSNNAARCIILKLSQLIFDVCCFLGSFQSRWDTEGCKSTALYGRPMRQDLPSSGYGSEIGGREPGLEVWVRGDRLTCGS